MDEALIEHAEDEIDHHKRRQDQERRGFERRLERLRVALEAAHKRIRRADFLHGALDCLHGLAQRYAGRGVEVYRGGGELGSGD